MLNNYPKLHNAMWAGVVGKGGRSSEPVISFATMLDLTAKADVGGIKFDGIDLFLGRPHVDIDSDEAAIERLAERIRAKNLTVGSVVAPTWIDDGGGSAMGGREERKRFLRQVGKACQIARRLRELGIRPYGIVRIDSAASVSEWQQDPAANTRRIAATFREAGQLAQDNGERLAVEGEICWGGLHSWKHAIQLLETVGQPKVVGFQADMSHTLLYLLGENAPEHRIVPRRFSWQPEAFHEGMTKLAKALRPWTIDLHIAQSDGSVFGSGNHAATGRHSLVTDLGGKLNIPRDSGYWLRGRPNSGLKHVCWDGCMFPNRTLMRPQTWNDILAAMIQVREFHGWSDSAPTDSF